MNGKKLAFFGVVLMTLSLVYFVFAGDKKEIVEWDMIDGVVLEKLTDDSFEIYINESLDVISTKNTKVDISKLEGDQPELDDKKLMLGDKIEFSEEFYISKEEKKEINPDVIYLLERGDYEEEEKEKGDTKEKKSNKDMVETDKDKSGYENDEADKDEGGESKGGEVPQKDSEDKIKNEDEAPTTKDDEGEEIINSFYKSLSNNDREGIEKNFENKNMVDNFVDNYDEFKLKYNKIEIENEEDQGDMVMYTVHAFSSSEVNKTEVAETILIGIPKGKDKIEYYEVLDIEES